MNHEDLNMESQRNAEALERELRKFSSPYSTPEPEERYWGALRMNIMDQIADVEAKASSTWMDRTKEWIAERRSISAITVAAVGSALVLLLSVNPFHSELPTGVSHVQSGTQPSQSLAANTTAPVTDSAFSVPDARLSAKTTDRPDLKSAKAPIAIRQEHQQPSRTKFTLESDPQDLASLEILSHADESVAQSALSGTEYPISLNELSAPELESVLADLQESK